MNRIQVSSREQIFQMMDAKCRAFEAAAPFSGIGEEWQVILNCLNTMLAPYGSEPWEFVLMVLAPDIPVFNVSFNLKTLIDCVDWDLLAGVLANLRLPWVMLVEFYDMIEGRVMIGGPEIREVMVADGEMHVWDA